jgi:enamine deaminase RidA (YjgF/YER057c/UK114 family)
MKVDFIHPKLLGPTNGWTPVVAVRGGKTIYVSGQVSTNEKGEAVGKGDLRAAGADY